MPGYTKDQLAAMNADPSQFKWCRKGCKLYWSKRGFASHARACGTDTKFLVNIATPPMPDPQPGDVVIKDSPRLSGWGRSTTGQVSNLAEPGGLPSYLYECEVGNEWVFVRAGTAWLAVMQVLAMRAGMAVEARGWHDVRE